MVLFLVLCAGALLGDKEPPQVWSALANCPVLDRATRRDCAVELFRRHVRRGMTLSELAGLLGKPTWLHEENVHHFVILGGFVPVNWDVSENSLYSVGIPPESDSGWAAAYLVVSGKTDHSEGRGVAQLLCGTGGDCHKDRVVLDVAVSAPHRERQGPRLPPIPSGVAK